MNDAKPTCGWNEAKPYRQPESEPPVRSTDWLGDGGEHKCEVCGKVQLPLGWPTPRLCMECGRERDKTIPKACPFCGNSGQAVWKIKEPDTNSTAGVSAWIECAICHARGPRADMTELAMPWWNRRKSPNDELSDSHAKTK